MTAFFPNLFDMYERQELTDFTVSIHGDTVRVHRVVLAARSPVFRAMLTAPMMETSSDFVEILDCRMIVFLELVKFMYLGQCDASKFPIELLKVAHKYEVIGLVDESERALLRTINSDKVFEYLSTAHLYNRETLKVAAFSFIRNSYRSVRKIEAWRILGTDFQLMTEFIMSLPPHTVDLIEFKDNLKRSDFMSSHTLRIVPIVEWLITWDEANNKEILESPDFKLIVGGQLLEFRLRFVCSAVGPNTRFAFLQIVLLSEAYKPPIELTANYFLDSNAKNKRIHSNHIIRWCGDSQPTTKFHRERTVLSIPVKDFTADTYCVNGHVVFQFQYYRSRSDQIYGGHLSHSVQQASSVFFENEQFADVHFKLGDVLIPGHRSILAPKSPFFDALFREEREFYELPEDPEDFRAILNYFYSGKMFPLSETLLKASEKFCIPVADVISRLPEDVSLETAVEYFITGHVLKSQPIINRALQFIQFNTKDVVSSAGWSQLKNYPELVAEIIDSMLGC